MGFFEEFDKLLDSFDVPDAYEMQEALKEITPKLCPDCLKMVSEEMDKFRKKKGKEESED